MSRGLAAPVFRLRKETGNESEAFGQPEKPAAGTGIFVCGYDTVSVSLWGKEECERISG